MISFVDREKKKVYLSSIVALGLCLKVESIAQLIKIRVEIIVITRRQLRSISF